MSTFFFAFSYYHQLRIQESRQYDKLKALVSAIGVDIDTEIIDEFLVDYPNKDDIKNVEDDPVYFHYKELMNKVVKYNNVNSPMYMITFNKDENYFEYLIRSDNNVYFRHAYVKYPEELLLQMETGGIIPKYETENGVWLSAFYPIKNSEGTVIALIEADVNFKSFIDNVRHQYFKTGMWTLFAVLGLALFLAFYARKILKLEREQIEKSNFQKTLIEQKNKDINASISYAKKIQDSIFPNEEEFDCFQNNFILFQPKDIVSGDFYWASKVEDVVFVAVADCTGHGVPGAMVSMICSEALNHVIKAVKLKNTGLILDAVSKIVSNRFSAGEGMLNDGMDISLCMFNLKDRKVQYSGANNSLYVINEQRFNVYPADRQPIGSIDQRIPFSSIEFDIRKGDKLYFFTDGFIDQFGGIKNKKYKSKNFKTLLFETSSLTMNEQCDRIKTELVNWMNGFDQVDDICVLGIEF